MKHDFSTFITYWSEHEVAFTHELLVALIAALPTYAHLPPGELLASIERKNTLWRHVLVTGDITPILERTQALVQQRFAHHFPLIEMVQTSDFYRDHLWMILRRFYAPSPPPEEISEQVEQWVRLDRDVVLRVYDEELQQTRAALHERVRMLEQQQLVIDDISTPLLTISDTAVMMPIVGIVDVHRVERIFEVLLKGVAKSQATVIILDITGVPVVDTYVASALIRVSRGVKMLGAQVVLTGIRPEVAQSVIELGVNLSGIITRGTLRDGIAYALHV